MHLLHHRGGRKIHRVGIYLPERSNNGTPHRVIATNYRILNIKSKKLVIFVNGMVVNVVLPDTAIDVAVLVNEANYETAMEVVRAYEKKEEGD